MTMKKSITAALSLLALTSYSHHVMAQLIDQTTFDFTQQIDLSTNMTIDWSLHSSGHTRYCGPRTVGGYSIAKKYCSPQTACGLSGPTAGVYGGNGNDCKERNYFDVESGIGGTGWMCFADIQCEAPSNSPSGVPSISPTVSVMPSGELTVGPSSVPSVSLRPTVSDKTGTPSTVPSTVPSTSPSKAPTSPPTNVPTSTPTSPPTSTPTSTPTIQPNTFNPTSTPIELSTIKLRGYFCGTSYQNAVEGCTASKSCNSHADCNDGEDCYPNVSCEFVASEASELGDHVDVVIVNVEDVDEDSADDSADEDANEDGSDSSAGDDAVLNFSNNGDSSTTPISFGFVCSVQGALVSLGVSVSFMMWMCTVV